jgi:hypothetical protein
MFEWFKRRRPSEGKSETVTPSRPIIGEYGTDRPAAFVRRPALNELTGVIPVAQTVRIPVGEVTLVSIERFKDGGIIRYFARGTEEARAAEAASHREWESLANDPEGIKRLMQASAEPPFGFALHLHLRMKDDIGTQYVSAAGGGGGGAERWEAGVNYHPPIPEAAKQLQISILRTSMRVLVPEPGSSSVEHLHTFVIDL